MQRKIAIIGAGGFGVEAACILREMLRYQNEPVDNFVGFFDDNREHVEKSYGVVKGRIDDLNKVEDEIYIAIAVGNCESLFRIKERLISPTIKFLNIVHPSLLLLDSNNCQIGIGNIISANVILSTAVAIGNFNIFNTRATLGHHVKVGDFNVFNPNVQISGNVSIGDQNFLGFNAGILQGVSIGDKNRLGAGAILLKSVGDDATYMGVPAKKFEY